MLRKSLVSSGLVLVLSATLTATAKAAPAGAPACTAPAGAEMSFGPTAGEVSDQEGAAVTAVNARADSVRREVEKTFGAGPAKERIADQLRRGLIGTAVDLASGRVTVVVTPQSRVRDTLSDGTTVIAGCHSAAALIAADDVLTSRSWHPQAAQAPFSYSLRAADSRFHVSFDSRFPAAAQALQKLLGDRVVVTVTPTARTGRLNDGRPHFGGAGVRIGPGSIYTNTCTTGFTVRRHDGVRGGMSAGHCFGNGDMIYSGPKPWGRAYGKHSYPVYDVIGIEATPGETYDNFIHTDNCCPVKREVIGRDQASVGELMCLSGMASKALCSVYVTSTNATFCDAAGCTYGLIEGIRKNEVIVRGGDSGAPMYTRYGSWAALAMGMVIAGAGGGTIVYGEHISHVEYYLGASVLTS